LVFPTFLFIVGNSMSFSMPKYESLSQAYFNYIFTWVFNVLVSVF
jgi:predicted acyltransferase